LLRQLKNDFIDWFQRSYFWWFSTIFGRLGLLFALAAFVLVGLTYYSINWTVDDKDNMLDIHDLYYQYTFVNSWNDFKDTLQIKRDLENLQLAGAIYYIDDNMLCSDDAYDPLKEQKLLYWKNTTTDFSICDYLGYRNSKNVAEDSGVSFPGYVSFGDIYIKDLIYPATVIEKDAFRVLLFLPSYAYPSELKTFAPIVLLSILFMLLLYLIVRKFLKPINLMQNRIRSLQSGDLDSEIPIIGKDELALLSLNFNNLIKQIKKLLSQKESLLSDVSHEIRTPLAKMKLLTAMIKSEDKITKIDKQISALDSIVTNILISDKLSAPYSNLSIESVSFENLINQALDLAKQQNVSITIDSPNLVTCDVVKMAIAIKNILDNAEKYAPSNEPITIKAGSGGGLATITIIDDGPGIPEDLLKTIAQPYVRGTNLKKSGFGLGLSICQKVISAHKGELVVSNDKDRGAIFKLIWPAQKQEHSHAKK
tara:strand:- start:1089 stop:2528 length:1440 start_codon:yes stop_codon:yes gene_type:complete